MSELVKDPTVTIPALGVKQRKAFAVKKAPKRFSVWWGPKQNGSRYDYDTITTMTDPDVNVPNEMIILENGR
jgi:hypothetical protein